MSVNRETDFKRVKADYKAAFDDWAAQVELLRMMGELGSDSPVIEEVRARADAAEAAYRETRDELVGMVPSR